MLAKELSKFEKKPVAIIGMMADKNVDEVLKLTLKHCSSAIAVTVPDMPRSMKAVELCAKAQKYCECITAESLEEAIDLANGKPLAVFGSLYLAGNIRPLLLKNFKKN